MRAQFANADTPEWADGLPAEVVTVVRREAERRQLPAAELVKEWTVHSARTLTTPPPPGRDASAAATTLTATLSLSAAARPGADTDLTDVYAITTSSSPPVPG